MLQGDQNRLNHVPGKENVMTDFLSRQTHYDQSDGKIDNKLNVPTFLLSAKHSV